MKISRYFLILFAGIIFLGMFGNCAERSLYPDTTDTNENYVHYIWAHNGTEWKFLVNDYDYYHTVVSGLEGSEVQQLYFSIVRAGTFGITVTYPDSSTIVISTNVATEVDIYNRNAVWFHYGDFPTFTYTISNTLAIRITDSLLGEIFYAEW